MNARADDRPGGTDVREVLTALGFVLGVNLLGALPSAVVGADTSWIDRPWFYPPEIAFPVVWTLLFTLLGIATYLVWRGTDRRAVRVALAAFGVQFALNLAWTPLFFGLRRPDLALGVIGLLAVAIAGTILAYGRVDRRAAALLVPYLAWVLFAIVLNYASYGSAAG
jgi:tryptophan-rich sensory protein